MMSLEPSVGITSQQLSTALWSANAGGDALSIASQPASGQLKAEVAYGFRAGDGLLTPYMDLLFSQSNTTYGVGVHYGLGNGLDLDLKATTGQGTNSNENSILLELQTEL